MPRCYRRPIENASSMLLSLAVCVVSGCGEPAAVTGSVAGAVTLDGVPLDAGVVTFEDPTLGRGASANIKNGQYAFPTPLLAGEYKVTVQPPPPPPPTAAPATAPSVVIAPKYLTLETSTLTASVKEGTNSIDFQLEK